MKDRFWSEDVVAIIVGVLAVAGVIFTIVFFVVEHADMTQRQETQRQQQIVTACKTTPDPQTCLELVLNSSATIINK